MQVSRSEPPLDRHMPVFTGKCFPTGEKLSRRYQVPAETEIFVWLVGDTLYTGLKQAGDTLYTGLNQVEAPAKQDRFRCSSASKTMNAQSHQKPYAYNEI